MHKSSISIKLIIILLICSLFITGCQVDLQQKYQPALEIEDATGAVVSVPIKPKRVAVLFSSFADIWITAGGSIEITVAETVERGFAAESAVLVDDGAGKSIDLEHLLAAEPDFVICSADIQAQLDASEICRRAGIPACAFRVECFDDYLALLTYFVQLTGQQDRLKQHGTDVAEAIEEMLLQHSNEQIQNSILFIRASSSAKTTKAKTAESHFACQMLNELGTYNIAEAAPALLDGLSFEEILIQDPDYIFISTMGNEEAAVSYMTSLLETPQWQVLTAVKNNRVIYLPKELFQFKPNSRWAEAYAYLINAMSS